MRPSAILVLTAAVSFSAIAPALLAQSAEPLWPDELDVTAMAFNIRYGSAADGPNHWYKRRDLVFEVLAESDADFLGLQEVLPFQLAEISSALPGYEHFSRTREVDPSRGEACPILYRGDTWQIDRRQRGTFWLSERPDAPGSKSWDSSLPRIATWARFEHVETGAAVWVFNTHFDHRGEEARRQSARLLREKTDAIAGDGTVLLLGDFNSGESSEPMKLLTGTTSDRTPLRDSYRKIVRGGEAYTFNGWGERQAGEKIDSVFVRDDTRVVDAAILRPRTDGRAPSDHDPVTATIRMSFARIELEIAELGGCSSCARGIARALEKDGRILRAALREGAPILDLLVSQREAIADEEISEIVRQAGYAVAAVRRR